MHIALKTSKYTRSTKYVILGKAAGLTDSKICLFAFPCFLVYYNIKKGLSFLLYYRHSNIS